MATNERSETSSEMMVMKNMVTMAPTEEGMVSKFVSKVPKPSVRRESVRYVAGGLTGMPKVRPLQK
jgi:hypothetical protein